MNAAPAVGLRGISKRFDTITAVDAIGLDIVDGEFFSLLGPSGCGKTTTLRMIAGLEFPTEGSLQIFVDEVGTLPPNKRPVNTVFQNYAPMQPIVAAGNSGFDVIVPSDYMVGIMIASGNVSQLNKDALPNLANLSAEFTNLNFDPAGEFSVPYQSGTTGIAVDTSVVGTDFDRSWSLIFDPEIADQFSGKISLLNDPRETLGAALKYLGYSLNTTSDDELKEAQELVSSTRDNLAAFDTDQADELLLVGETAIGHGYSGDMFVQFLEADDPSTYVYFVPKDGGARWVDNMSIPFGAPHPCTAHTFINWILDADNGAALTNWNYYTTPNEAAKAGLDQELLDFINDPAVVVGGPDSLEMITDTGDFEINYSDAFIAAKG